MTPGEFNRQQMKDGKLTDEHVAMLVKSWQEGHGLDGDGFAGVATQATLDAELYKPKILAPRVWRPWDGPEEKQPTNRREVYQMFGNPGKGEPDRKWARDNIITLHQSRGNQLPGVPGNRWVEVHKDIEPYLREALRRAVITDPDYVIERIAGYVFRHTRHDPSRPLSLHSWGIAVDINPHLSSAKYFAKDEIPEAFSNEWNRIWPKGVPKEYVAAMQSCGFAWGSDWDEDGDNQDHRYQDPMHFEWVARDDQRLAV